MTVTLIVLDSVGVGALPDAEAFGDAGAHTLDHVVAHTGVALPNLSALGLGHVPGVEALAPSGAPRGAFGRLAERSPGKDTSTGHWEFMGAVLDAPFRTFHAFPPAVMEAFDAATGRGHLGNRRASGTEILEALGPEHERTGEPIVYTSADSVFQVAAHVDVVPLDRLYAWCEAARALLVGEHAVARVIARPFRGEAGAYERLHGQRKDLSLEPPPLVLNALERDGREVVAVGKIADIYAGAGITRTVTSGSNEEGVDRTLELLASPAGERGRLVFANLVDFDARFGHRRDVVGYADALAAFDARLPELLQATAPGDALLLVSDHGNDPTWHGTDHTREYGLLLAYAPGAPRAAGAELGTRASFADVGATVAALLGTQWNGAGESFAGALR